MEKSEKLKENWKGNFEIRPDAKEHPEGELSRGAPALQLTKYFISGQTVLYIDLTL